MAAHRLYVLSCGFLIDTRSTSGLERVPVPAYLIRAASGRNYLIDAGNPAAMIGAKNCEPWYWMDCDVQPGDDPIARLAELGLAPGDIDAIIATHFDFDHAGRYDAFGHLRTDVYVQRSHLAAALAFEQRYKPGLWKIPGLRWRHVDGDYEIEPGIRLILTNGHAVGHQSIAVETASGWVVLAIDAIDEAQLINSRDFPRYEDDEIIAANASIDRLLVLAAELDAPLIFGHDYEQWSRITLSPSEFRIS